MTNTSSSSRLGVVLLCHDELDVATRMARIWSKGGAAVAIHVDVKADAKAVTAMQQDLADLPDIIWIARQSCEWGKFSLVAATQSAASELLNRFPDVSHVFLASGSCLPLRPIGDLKAYLDRHQGVDFIESANVHDVGWTIGGFNIERFSLYFHFSWRKQRWAFDRLVNLQRRLKISRKIPDGIVPHLGSQWWCLTRKTLMAILNDPARPQYERYFKTVWIPDESYFQSLVRRHSIKIESLSLTLSKFDDQGKPYIFYEDHLLILEQSGCFVARKIWPGAHKLFTHFPLPVTDPPHAAAPRRGKIDRLINQAVARRNLGRPGLYMQSRFPGKDRENGKTSAPYMVLQGFSDLYPQFASWMQMRADADIAGHLFGPDQVEFAHGGEFGPGMLSNRVEPRDYDPFGFLTSLIRITERTQVFQYSVRDNQALNWFMATDPNARISVITGAWTVPLMHSDMPFDDIRRAAARFQRIELAQLEILKSVWVKAQVDIWELGDFLARPQDILHRIVHDLAPHPLPPDDPLPRMQDVSGLPRFLQSLRNAGLQPRLMGDLTVIEPAGDGNA